MNDLDYIHLPPRTVTKRRRERERERVEYLPPEYKLHTLDEQTASIPSMTASETTYCRKGTERPSSI
jgi:hypothetical protein